MTNYRIVDLFAGPGGLAEGFAGYRHDNGESPFRVAFSVEKEQSAHSTLRLRAFLRSFTSGFPDEYYDILSGKISVEDLAKLYPKQWEVAENEALNFELGTRTAHQTVSERISELDGRRTVLVGGPPCQAYSLVGRARNQGRANYRPEKDKKHFLYQEYINILEQLKPAAFVMENVKGLLSSKIKGKHIGESILADLESACEEFGGYRLFPLARSSQPAQHTPSLSDFLIRAEYHGIPQARHRVIIVGIRSDLCSGIDLSEFLRLKPSETIPCREVLSLLPKLRSGLSKGEDSDDKWECELARQMRVVGKAMSNSDEEFSAEVKRLIKGHDSRHRKLQRTAGGRSRLSNSAPEILREWIVDPRIKKIANHETRGHMSADIGRYFFASVFARVNGFSPKATDFPNELAPNHANWTSGKFADRFRVQLPDLPSTTVTSHISKDGHYFIHPDPLQCRSLTVREAARLQTFPDNYLFLGNRTEQYVQVGNAVPPLLARQIADALYRAFSTIDLVRGQQGRRRLAG